MSLLLFLPSEISAIINQRDRQRKKKNAEIRFEPARLRPDFGALTLLSQDPNKKRAVVRAERIL